MTIDSFVAEIKTSMRRYSEAGLIDENTVYKQLLRGLKKFGNSVAELQEEVATINSGSALLPEGFFSLDSAYLCDPLGYQVDDRFKNALQGSSMYIQRTTKTTKWNECTNCCFEQEEKVIREDLIFDGGTASFYYHQPQLLTLGRAFDRSFCKTSCANKFFKGNPNEISINNYERLQANFNSGEVYMTFYGLPRDENGEIMIPNASNGDLEEYLEYRVKAIILEDLILNREAAPGAEAMLSLYMGKADRQFRAASNSLKMESLTPQNIKKLKYRNRLETLTYEKTW